MASGYLVDDMWCEFGAWNTLQIYVKRLLLGGGGAHYAHTGCGLTSNGQGFQGSWCVHAGMCPNPGRTPVSQRVYL